MEEKETSKEAEKEIRSKITFHPVGKCDEVLSLALCTKPGKKESKKIFRY